MFDSQLAWLREQAKTRYRILELGAWKGLSTQALASSSPGKIWVVDRWDSDDPGDEATKSIQEEGRESVFQTFLDVMRPWGRKLIILRMESHEAWKRLGHIRFDMVWLDGDHRYGPTCQAIKDWRALLTPKGLLCGHDGEYPDVKRAVQELVPNAQFHETAQPSPYQHRPSIIWYSYALG